MNQPQKWNIFAVDDERWLMALWVPIKLDGLLGDVDLRWSDRPEEAVSHAGATSGQTLYVLDCKLAGVTVQLLQESSARIREVRQLNTDRFANANQEILRGLYVGAYLKILRPDCRVMLLTAFFNEIRSIPGIDEFVKVACEEFVPKQDAHETLAAIQRCIDRP